MASTNQSKFTSKLLNAKVLILGGTSGMGFAVAEGSLEFGARVVISSSSASKLDNALNRLRTAYPSSADKISGYTCDLSKPEQLEGNIKALLEKAGGGIDHVVFTAGDRLSVQPLDTFTPEVMSKAMTVRVTAPMVLAKVVGPYLSPGPKTSISLTSGTQSYKPTKDWAMIAGVCSAIEGFVRGLAVELAPTRVNLVVPGAIMTELFQGMGADKLPAFVEFFKKQTLVDKIGAPEDVAETYLYFMKDSFVTGQVVMCDGGRLLS